MSSILPDVGTVYSSLPAFKLDVFERGLQGSLWLSTRTASPNGHSQIHCAIKVGAEKQFCSFRIVARNGHGVTKVTIVETEHSCEGHDAESKRIAARSKMQDMVEKARGEKEDFENSKESEEEVELSQDQDLKVTQKRTAKSIPSGAGEWNEEIDESSSATSDYESDSDDQLSRPSSKQPKVSGGTRLSKLFLRETYPPARDLQLQIDALKKSGTVHLPSIDDSFDTPRELLIVLYAYSQQRNFTINRRSPDGSILNPTSLLLSCYRRHRRYQKQDGICKYTLNARRNPNGTWSFASVMGSHNHKIAQFDEAARPKTQGVKRKIDDFETSKPQPSLLPASNSYPIPSFASSHPASQSSPHPRIRSIQPQALASLDPIPSIYSSDLVSFLRSFRSSPTNLSHLLNKLHDSGVNSLATLLEILMMEDESLELFVGMLDDEGVGKKLLEMVREMRSENGMA